MTQIFRFGISLPKNLLDKFDGLIKEKRYTNRSKAFGDLIRQELVKKEWQVGKEIAGAITLIYDHHKRELLNKITTVLKPVKNINWKTGRVENCDPGSIDRRVPLTD